MSCYIDNASLVIKHIESGEEFRLGSEGVIMDKTVMTKGNFKNVQEYPNNYRFVINIDLPTRLELDDKRDYPYYIRIGDACYNVFHIIKQPQEKIFSALNTTYLPYFSSIQIQGINLIDKMNKNTDNYMSLDIILAILQKLNNALNDNILQQIINRKINIPYEILYIDKLRHIADTQTLHLLNIQYAPKSKNYKAKNSFNHVQMLLNEEKINIQNFAENNKYENEVFKQRLFNKTHDFAFYSKQHAETYYKLSEEDIRNLYVMLIRLALTDSCETEAFNYDGKTDFKITNPDNKYEFYIGEFKIWNSQKSIEELCMQSFEKHITGREEIVYMIMLNKNKDFQEPLNKCLDYISSQSCVITAPRKIQCNPSSKEHFYEFDIDNRGNQIKVIFAMFDIYHNVVK